MELEEKSKVEKTKIEIAYLNLLTAQTSYSQTNLAYIEALGELWAAKVEIEGLLLKDSLSGGAASP